MDCIIWGITIVIIVFLAGELACKSYLFPARTVSARNIGDPHHDTLPARWIFHLSGMLSPLTGRLNKRPMKNEEETGFYQTITCGCQGRVNQRVPAEEVTDHIDGRSH
ncbi:uncharacterized protein LOC135367125 [Ornithodoros turicata]|uniref:uncharacterized protein LOC135367125 n=1 Tax=Ornithodoros turicata TaxID=34597 RepID=UPI00313972C0